MAKPLSTTYLYRNPRSSHFFFRMRIPCFLQGVVSRRELRCSLQTSDQLEAKYRAIIGARVANRFFAALSRNWWWIMKEMTTEEIDYLVCKYMVDLLKYFEDYRVLHNGPEKQVEYDWNMMLLDKNLDEAQKQLILSDHEASGEGFDDILSNWGGFEEIDKESYTYKKLRREFLKARIQVLKVEKKRELGDYTDTLEDEASKRLQALQPLLGSPSALPASLQPVSDSKGSPAIPYEASTPPGTGERLSEVIEKFAEERRRAGVWKPKSEVEIMTSLRLLVEVLGDVPVTDINNVSLRRFKETLMELPPNVRKNPAYRDKSIAEVIASGVTKRMNTSTINKQLDRASTLFKWAVQNGYVVRNPGEGLQLPAKKRDDEYRAAFNSDDLKMIFNSRVYCEDTHKYGYRFWLPVIALYSGLRLNEICQLHLEDVHEDDEGVFVFDIRERKGVTNTKTSSSERLVPLHDFLRVDLNLPGFVAKLRSDGETRLFPDLKKRRDGYGQAASRWFAGYRANCDIVEGPGGKKDFHSFRHTVSNTLKQLNAEHFPTQELLGHSTGSITFGRYGKRYSPKLLKEQVVDRLVYDVDMSHLKKSRFVVKSKS
jgi:integrase